MITEFNESDSQWMLRAVELAKRGEGMVEPNPMVGCVLVKDEIQIGEGWHRKFGGPHAEVNAITDSVQRNGTMAAKGATAYVTLEPCSHSGKTGPCADALIAAKVQQVVVATLDTNPAVIGRGIEKLTAAGIEVRVGCREAESNQVLAPYLKLIATGMPWLIGKWAMTLDGKIATSTGDSKWISSSQSRAVVHQIRSRVDGIMVGIGTALADDPMLNVRLKNSEIGEQSRKLVRIVLDSTAKLSLESKLCQTADEQPVLIAVGPDAPADKIKRLESAGCEVLPSTKADHNDRLRDLLAELGRRKMTNVLIEGGGKLLGSLNDLQQIDEIHIFVGSKLTGGAIAQTPVAGVGFQWMKDSAEVNLRSVQQIGNDVYLQGRVVR